MQTYVRCLILSVLYVGCAEFAFLAFIQNPGNPDVVEKARLTSMVDGTGHRPYVYRTLLPTTVRCLRAVIPQPIERGLVHFAQRFDPVRRLFDSTPAAEGRDPATYLLAYALEFLCVLAFALTLRAAVAHFHGGSPWLADLAPLVAVVGLPVFYRYVNHDYDLPQVFLFSLGFLLLAKRRWVWFYPVLLLGALNKETALLLVVVHVLGHAPALSRRELIGHGLAQLVVVLGVRCVLQFWIFADNPGAPVEEWTLRNWQMILDPARWGFLLLHFTWVGHLSLIVPTNYNLLFLLLVPLIVWRWSLQPVILRRALWIAPIEFLPALFFGYIDEMRIYYEVYPIVFLLIVGSVGRCVASPLKKQPLSGCGTGFEPVE